MGLDAQALFDNYRAAYDVADPAMQMFIRDQIDQFREMNRAALRIMHDTLETKFASQVILFPQDAACTIAPVYSVSVLWLAGSGQKGTTHRQLIDTTIGMRFGQPDLTITQYDAAIIPLEEEIVNYRWDVLNEALNRKNDLPVAQWYAQMLR
jgi:hypothetical protein